MKRLDIFLIVAALILACVTIAAVVVRAGGHESLLTAPAHSIETPATAKVAS